MKQIDIQKHIEYFDVLKTKRSKHTATWEDIKTYIIPLEKVKDEIFDSTARWAREQLASGLQSLLINPSSTWFNISPNVDEEEILNSEAILLWTDIVNKKLMQVFHSPQSNFYSSVHEFFLTLTAFGTAIFYIEEDVTLTNNLFFKNINLEECYLEENRLGNVDQVYRNFKIKLKSAVAKWDVNELKKRAEKNGEEEIEILHVVTPSNQEKGKFKYQSCYIDLDSGTLLSESGYDYFPFLVCRWMKEGDVYGYSPAHHILPDIKMLNMLRKLSLESSQKMLRPPMLIPKDGFFLPLQQTAGSYNFYRPGIADKIIPLIDIRERLSTHEEEAVIKEAILKAYYVDIFRMQKENKEMTATEVSYRSEEQMRLMSPITGRIETEFLNPLITAVHSIAVKYQTIPQLEADGSIITIDIEYSSPLTRSQKNMSITAIEQVLSFFARLGINNLMPELYDNIDFDKVFRLGFSLRGAPAEVLRDEKDVARIRASRMQAMNQG